MDSPLPSNETLQEISAAMPWQDIEAQKRKFNQVMKTIAADASAETLPLEQISDAVGVPVTTYYDANDSKGANVVLAHINGHQHVLGAAVSTRYRGQKTLAQSLVPYNFNPSVNHKNIQETDDPTTRMRSLGAEIELGLVHINGAYPTEDDMQHYMRLYRERAQKLGITPQVDREAGQYQIEAHVAPVLGYHKTRAALGG